MAPSPHTSRRALIVEDESAIREIVRLHLSLAGFETDEVADGRAALDRLRTERFDLVVLDVMLPGVDGVTVCRALRSGGLNERAAVLMLTAIVGAVGLVSLQSVQAIGGSMYADRVIPIRDLAQVRADLPCRPA